MSWFNFQPLNDIDRGREALKYYHNESVKFPNYGLTFDELITRFGGSNFLEGMGLVINSGEMSDSHVQEAMENLANQGQGRMPGNFSIFYKALSDREANLTVRDWVGGIPEISKNIASDIGKGAVQIGNAVIDTGKSLLVVGPLLIVAAVIFIGYSKVKRLA